MGEPAAVPAGVYGRKWLEHEGAWAEVESKVDSVPDGARRCLSAVEAGRVDAGIVYRTDAMTSDVRVIARMSRKDHPYLDIAYPVAVIVGPTETEARRFLEFLNGPTARAVFDRAASAEP